MGAKVVVSGKVDATGLYIMELPSGAAPDWEISLLAGDDVVAGPLAVSLDKPGLGIDWTLSEGDESTDIVQQTHPNWNRVVTRAIVHARGALPVLVAKSEEPAPPRSSTVILEKADPAGNRPKRIATGLEDLEDDEVLALARRFSEPETVDRLLRKLGIPNASQVQLYGQNTAPGFESMIVRIDWRQTDAEREFLNLYLAKTDASYVNSVTRKGRRIFSPWERSIASGVTSPLPNRIGTYDRWQSKRGLSAAKVKTLHGEFVIVIVLNARREELEDQDRMLALLEELEAMVTNASTP